MCPRAVAASLAAAAALLAALLAAPVPPGAAVAARGGAPTAAISVRASAAASAAKALTFYTVSNATLLPHRLEAPAEVEALWGHFEASYPLAFAALAVERVAGHSRLLTWAGTNASALPGLMVSHVDVVPVAGVTATTARDHSLSLPGWPAPPFAGAIRSAPGPDGVARDYIVGRGAVDAKGQAAAILEAVESLLASGFAPATTLHIAVGHDEEVRGTQGAAGMAVVLKRRGVRFAWCLDEGGVVVPAGLPPLVSRPIALVGVAEKGYATLALEVEAGAGHAALPPRAGASAAAVAAAAAAYADADRPYRVAPPTDAFLRGLAEAADRRWARLALLAAARAPPSAVRALLSTLPAPATIASLFGTSVALVGVAAGGADNVVPGRATVRANYRLAAPDTLADAVAHLERAGKRALTHAHAANVSVRVSLADAGWLPASTAADARHPAFAALAAALAETTPSPSGIAVVPYLLAGATDSRHYRDIAHTILRFTPFAVPLPDLAGVHGAGERLAVDSFVAGVRVYAAFLERALV